MDGWVQMAGVEDATRALLRPWTYACVSPLGLKNQASTLQPTTMIRPMMMPQLEESGMLVAEGCLGGNVGGRVVDWGESGTYPFAILRELN